MAYLLLLEDVANGRLRMGEFSELWDLLANDCPLVRLIGDIFLTIYNHLWFYLNLTKAVKHQELNAIYKRKLSWDIHAHSLFYKSEYFMLTFSVFVTSDNFRSASTVLQKRAQMSRRIVLNQSFSVT